MQEPTPGWRLADWAGDRAQWGGTATVGEQLHGGSSGRSESK
jgi:hypothetical protein